MRDPGKGSGRRDTWTPKNVVGTWGVGDHDGGASRGLPGKKGPHRVSGRSTRL